MTFKRKYLGWSIGVVLVLTMIVAVSWPESIPVEVAPAQITPLRVTIDEEGVTRVRQRFLVAAPVAGQLRRIELEEGDAVQRGQVIVHLSPSPLDVRAQAQAQARLDAATALEREARAHMESARANLAEAQRQEARAESLAVNNLISAEQRDLARLQVQTSAKTLEAAEFRTRAAESDAEAARAALLASTPVGTTPPDAECIEVVSPISGRVLRVLEENERIVQPGTPLIELGDPSRLEIVVDLLSTDAVKVQPGAGMWIEEWGGDTALPAVVRLVEPSGFTKVSALGVEEQRVNVIADFTNNPASLGDGFRVETKIVLWESDSVLTIPWSALVRRGAGWGVYVMVDQRARWRDIEVGHRGSTAIEILSGLERREQVVLHPPDDLHDGARIKTE